MLNVLIALAAGLVIFSEKHSVTQYVGGLIIIGAVILITFERTLGNDTFASAQHSNFHFISIFFTLISCFSWSMMIITTKYCTYNYDVDIVEYASLAMTLSGFIGSLTGLPIYYFGTPMNFLYKNKILSNVMFAVLAGLFTTMGQFSYYSAVSLGSVEVSQLFINTKPIVQMVEELILFSIFPNFLALVGVALAIFGAGLVIVGKPKKASDVVVLKSDQ